MKHSILHLTPAFNYADGRSYYIYLLLKYFKLRGHEVYLCTDKGDSFDRIEELGIRIFAFPELSAKTSFLKSVKFVSEIVAQNRINIIHTHHRYQELLSNSMPKNSNVHTVFTALSIVDKRFFVEYKSEKIIAVSNSVKEMLIKKFNIDENKISLIPNFVDSEEESGSKLKPGSNRNSLEENKQVIILSIGRFHKEKNYETLLKAIVLLKDLNLKLILVGEGEEKKSYEKIIKENSLNVKFFPPQRNLKEFFDISDICILTSLRDPFPGFMLQSGLNKKPFIGSNVDGISELIKDGVNGLLFEKENEHALAEKIELFNGNTILAAKCAETLNELVLEKYTQKTVVPCIEELYNNLLR
ncbi:MAG: glycosyltransferase family 4 protein [Bacteroidota bacterium]|nr:glycosyltransferase family 4 protein [Bacteroidota bacterium]